MPELTNNQVVIHDIMNDWNCTELEAYASLMFDTKTLEETQKAIAKAVTYQRLIENICPGKIAYLRNEYYKDDSVTEEFLLNDALEETEAEAEMFVYFWEQVDDYDTMTEDEKEFAIYE